MLESDYACNRPFTRPFASKCLVLSEVAVNITQIKYFVTVLDKGSFSLAAKEQFVTVQAVSKAISELENELNRQLFTRENRGVTPTPFGKAFGRKAVNALKAFNSLESFAQASSSEAPCLSLAVHAPAIAASSQICESIEAFVQSNLGIPAIVSFTDGERWESSLKLGAVDAIITIGGFEHPRTDCVPFLNIPTGVSVALNHPLAAKEEVTIDDLAPFPVGASPHFDGFSGSILNTYRNKGLKSEVRTITSKETVAPFAHEDFGYFFSAALPFLSQQNAGSTILRITGEGAMGIPLCLVTLKNKKSASYEALLSMLLSKRK